MQRKNIKCIIVGSYGAGKTELCNRYTRNLNFSEEHHLTLGVEHTLKNLSDGSKLHILDTAGQASFESNRVTHYQNTRIALLCCDLANRNSYDELDSRLYEIRTHVPDNAVIGLVGTKADKADRKISDKELEAFKTKHHLDFVITCSAKNGSNVEKVFSTALDRLEKKVPLPVSSIPSNILRTAYRANGGGFIATIKIFGLIGNNSSEAVIEKMQERTALHDGGASEMTLRKFNLL